MLLMELLQALVTVGDFVEEMPGVGKHGTAIVMRSAGGGGVVVTVG